MPNGRPDSERKPSDRDFIQLDDGKGAAPAAPACRGCIVAGLLAVACVALIVVSLGFVHPSESGAWSLSWMFQSVDASASTGTSETSSKTAAKAKKKDAAESNEGASDDDEADDAAPGADEGSQASASSDGGSAGTDSAAAAPASSSASSQRSSGASSGQASAGEAAPADSGLITVTVSVTSSAVGNPVSAGGTYSFKRGASVYDALCALGLSVNAHGSAYGTYVAAVGGLAEKEHGGTSGWMYSVNGVAPNVACSAYKLSDGDNVVWYYVTG